jgi:protein MpaA
VILGYSVGGRPIEGQRVGAADGLDLLLFGGIHGDEPGSATLCERWLYERAPSNVRALVIPSLNPDGLLRNQKDNARGVDLNRNFPARNWTREHPAGYDPGSAPLSEPEAATLARLIGELAPRLLIAVHQPFRCVNWDGPAAEIAQRMSAVCGYPAVASVGYPTPGSFGSCYGVDGNLPVITFELPRPVPEADYATCVRALDCATLEPSVR